MGYILSSWFYCCCRGCYCSEYGSPMVKICPRCKRTSNECSFSQRNAMCNTCHRFTYVGYRSVQTCKLPPSKTRQMLIKEHNQLINSKEFRINNIRLKFKQYWRSYEPN